MAIKAQRDKPIKLDAIDKKIFYYLSVNYRIQRNKLAKLVRISPQRLNHRIKQLEKQILAPYICLNYPLLGIKSYLLFYKHLSEEEIKAISEAENTYYLLKLIGKYQYLAIVLTTNIIEFCGKNTRNLIPEIFPLTNYFPDKWDGFEVQRLKERQKKYKEYSLDAKDYRILACLCEEPSASQFDLSRKIKMSRQTIAKRMRLMEEADIIQGYRFSVNIPKIGILTYMIILTCRPSELEKIKSIIQNSRYSGFLFQSYNHLIFPYIVFNHNQLFDFLEEIETKTNCLIDIAQNTGNYIVEPVPRYVKGTLKKLLTGYIG